MAQVILGKRIGESYNRVKHLIACPICHRKLRRWITPYVILRKGKYMHFVCWLKAGLPD